ncbi:hypothetical protein FALBO_15271 [Fusarium albosuccineum]|uniref:Uncharacterized protein n=1 Tax=Fusarium albosuccineum TaxID=1237068 RepID=A0A8H4KWK9_9HYPO|nr:hypothetical protein FALBO_15271 [Fusarium albosuccineum]
MPSTPVAKAARSQPDTTQPYLVHIWHPGDSLAYTENWTDIKVHKHFAKKDHEFFIAASRPVPLGWSNYGSEVNQDRDNQEELDQLVAIDPGFACRSVFGQPFSRIANTYSKHDTYVDLQSGKIDLVYSSRPLSEAEAQQVKEGLSLSDLPNCQWEIISLTNGESAGIPRHRIYNVLVTEVSIFATGHIVNPRQSLEEQSSE